MAAAALDVDRHAPISHPDRFYIGGEWVEPSTESRIDVIAPATEELVLRVAEAQEADIANAVAAARKAFDGGPWPRLSHGARADYLRAMARKLAEQSGLGREGGVEGLLPFLEAKTLILEGVPSHLSKASGSSSLHS